MKKSLVHILNQEMIRRGWNQKHLEKESGVNQATISRLLNGCVNIKVESIYRILLALNLLHDKRNEAVTCPVGCDAELMEICRDIKGLRDSKTHWWDSLAANIHSFKQGLENDLSVGKIPELERKIMILEKLTSPGRSGGMSNTPAGPTAKRQRAG